MRLGHLCVAALTCGTVSYALAGGQTWYVDPVGGSDGASGLSEAEAVQTIQIGILRAADGDTVLLLPGTYSGIGNEDVALLGKTISIVGRDGPDATIIQVVGDPTCHEFPAEGLCVSRAFLVSAGQGRDLRFEGLTICDGGGVDYNLEVPSPASLAGGAMLITGSPTIVDCVFRSNFVAGRRLGVGGAVHALGGPRFERCLFEDNGVGGNGDPNSYGNGGAVYTASNLLTTEDTEFIDCEFVGNKVHTTEGSGAGGAIFANEPVLIVGSRFVDNEVGAGEGGAVRVRNNTLGGVRTISEIDRCEFSNNRGGIDSSGSRGGAMFVEGEIVLSNSLFAGNRVRTTTEDCAVDGDGGAVYLDALVGLTTIREIQNCTFVDNDTDTCTNAIVSRSPSGNGPVVVENSVFWGNDVGAEALAGDIGVARTIVQGGYPGAMDEDPVFVDASGGDYHLSAGSPAIDAGDNTLVVGDFDLDGNARRVDDPMTPDTGVGTAPIVDLGAYEFGATASGCNAADLAEPLGSLDFSDVVAFLGAFVAMSPEADLAEPVGTFDFSDVVAFLGAFGAGCP